MARMIYKYDMSGHNPSKLNLSAKAKFLFFGEQGGDLKVWFETDPQALQVLKTLLILPTGAAVPLGYEHLQTMSCDDAELIWHLYERTV